MLQTKIENQQIEASGKNFDKFATEIKKRIRKNKSSNITIDISHLNLIDAIKITSIASTYHFLKFETGCINWIVKSKEYEKMIRPINLGNNKFICT